MLSGSEASEIPPGHIVGA